MLWRIYKTEFHSAHHIKDHPTCGRPHGHTYKLTVRVAADEWLDFHDLKQKVDSVVTEFDHRDLGDMTCENLAKKILYQLRKVFPTMGIKIRLFETSEFGVESD